MMRCFIGRRRFASRCINNLWRIMTLDDDAYHVLAGGRERYVVQIPPLLSSSEIGL